MLLSGSRVLRSVIGVKNGYVEHSKPPSYRKQGRLDGYGLPTNNRDFPRILTELLSEGRAKRWEHDRALRSS